ncbi:hypothetical protein EW026_g5306 [Hermanssonia centrifuga]|uniref:Uncharacterized protein n=1 Tax=Hermanssonia centrifuga TaxID=98765 RepID=A0A4V3XA75_9APHY|nr:hypothetical protein EW026_g5306 [Hermanssonia centrifuga]
MGLTTTPPPPTPPPPNGQKQKMAITNTQKTEIEAIIQILLETSTTRRKRRLADMFLDLVDRDSWPEYYEIIPAPRSINIVKESLAKNKYQDPLQLYEDLSLVFLNALFYNEDGSQISKDADSLKTILDKEWRERAVLPTLPDSLPASSAQVTHGVPLSAQPSTPIPATSTPTQSSPKRAADAPHKSPERQMTPEMDVDVGGTPEPEGVGNDMAPDGETDAIVQQLEKGLPKWEGLEDIGWATNIPEERLLEIVLSISGYQDQAGNRLAVSLEVMPEETNIPELPYKSPLSLALIERLYQALTSSDPPAGPPFLSPTHFAALPAGPGTARPLHSSVAEGVPGVTTFRVSSKDRKFVDEVHVKGWTIRLADWLHLSNCDDPSRPIIAQVFRCWVSDEPSKKGQPGITVCWYFRPEQTFHPVQRQFWENEIFKTSHFADHPLEDVIEKIACQFTARHIRGRPRPPYWYPGWPLYVCDSRYNDRERIFVKIKNWNSCVPEEVRKSAEFMPIYPFERPVFPRRFASPFISGKPIKAPGGIGDVIEKAEGEKIEGGGIGRKRPRKNAAGPPAPSRSEVTDRVGQSKGFLRPKHSMDAHLPSSHA